MLRDLQRVLLRACLLPDPRAALAAAAADPEADLTASERDLLRCVDADGLRLTGLLLVKLRFERLLGGDPALRSEFDAEPVGFTEEFRRYCSAVPARAVLPEEEAAAFHAFRAEPDHG